MTAGENLGHAAAAFATRAGAIRAAQWVSPTPCAAWDVRALVNHVVGEVRWIAPLLDGSTIAEVGDRLDGDLVGEDALSAWAAAVDEALAAIADPGALERIVHLSFGDRGAGAYVADVTADIVIHTWDLARATGGDETLDADLVAFAAATLEPQVELWRGAGAFGPAVDVSAGADEQTRLLALVGRVASG